MKHKNDEYLSNLISLTTEITMIFDENIPEELLK